MLMSNVSVQLEQTSSNCAVECDFFLNFDWLHWMVHDSIPNNGATSICISVNQKRTRSTQKTAHNTHSLWNNEYDISIYWCIDAIAVVAVSAVRTAKEKAGTTISEGKRFAVW